MYQHGLGYTRYPTAINNEYKYWGWWGPRADLSFLFRPVPLDQQLILLVAILVAVFVAIPLAIALAPILIPLAFIYYILRG